MGITLSQDDPTQSMGRRDGEVEDSQAEAKNIKSQTLHTHSYLRTNSKGLIVFLFLFFHLFLLFLFQFILFFSGLFCLFRILPILFFFCCSSSYFFSSSSFLFSGGSAFQVEGPKTHDLGL